VPASPLPDRLSEHLLAEARRFLLYPKRMYRTESNLDRQANWDERLHAVVEWRKTFAPQAKAAAVTFLSEPILLDELYCRELLAAVPRIVERTMLLSETTLEGPEPEAIAYLRQAASCFILGLPEAAVALCRTAIEADIRAKAAERFGAQAAAAPDLKDLIEDLARRGQVLKPDGIALAHRVRILARDVLHKGARVTDEQAREALEAARQVVLLLRSR
jgi:hypothetical protein